MQVTSPADIGKAKRLIFPGVGACGQALAALQAKVLGWSPLLAQSVLPTVFPAFLYVQPSAFGTPKCTRPRASCKQGYVEALREYLLEGRPYLGICLGLQLLFDGSDENGGLEGLGIVPGRVTRFEPSPGAPVPQIGWNILNQR